jgi:hypothetical protein
VPSFRSRPFLDPEEPRPKTLACQYDNRPRPTYHITGGVLVIDAAAGWCIVHCSWTSCCSCALVRAPVGALTWCCRCTTTGDHDVISAGSDSILVALAHSMLGRKTLALVSSPKSKSSVVIILICFRRSFDSSTAPGNGHEKQSTPMYTWGNKAHSSLLLSCPRIIPSSSLLPAKSFPWS